MPTYYYGTVPSLAWILGHYYYGAQHYSWLSLEYFPYLLNPKSSNPHLIYQDLYQPWRDKDDYDKTINQSRLNLRKGVLAAAVGGSLSSSLAVRLLDICDDIDIMFFYPLVIRADLDQIDSSRQVVAGSGVRGSKEVLVSDLAESEFDILFVDYAADADLVRLVQTEVRGTSVTTSADALVILEGRC